MNPVAERITQAMAEGTKDIAARSSIKGLTEEDVREGKTPEGIAKLWLERMLSQKKNKAIFEQEEREAKKGTYPLLPYSQLVWEMEQQMPGVYTFPMVLQYDPEQIDTARLNKAIEQAIANHPVFRGNEQYYDIKAESGYLKMRFNRILGDGYSFGLLLEDICKAYQGIELEPDYYFRYLKQVEEHKQSEEYAEHRRQLEKRYGKIEGAKIPVRPTLDKEIEDRDEWLAGEYTLSLSETASNEDVCLATAIAIMDYCGTDEAALTWAYLGRENEQERHIFGSLHKDIPMRIRRPHPLTPSPEGEGEDKERYRQQVREEIERGIVLSDYPWTLTDPQHEVWKYAVNVLQQPKWEDINLHGMKLVPVDEPLALSEAIWEKGATQWRERGSYSLLDIEIEENQLRFKYSATHYKEESIIRFAEMIKKNLE